MKTYSLILLALATILFSCSQPKDAEAQKALADYIQFVDSIAEWNAVWKVTADTHFVEIPIDPNDPTITVVDTIITTPDQKTQSIVTTDFFGKLISKQYDTLNSKANSLFPKMDKSMKAEYEKAKLVYEGLK